MVNDCMKNIEEDHYNPLLNVFPLLSWLLAVLGLAWVARVGCVLFVRLVLLGLLFGWSGLL
jgi:membrane protein insertase Oxa1/YidC/SpoIIIJ